MADITWKVRQIEALNTGTLAGVVVTVCFDVSGEEGNLRGFTQGDVKLAPPDAANFSSLSSVTESQVLAWTHAALGTSGVATFEGRVQEQIDSLKVAQPKVVPLPWAPGADDTSV